MNAFNFCKARPRAAFFLPLLGLFSTFFFPFFSQKMTAQTGCPGCLVDLPDSLAADTIFLDKLPDGQQNEAYEANISFRLPKSTTPVSANDTTVPAGLPISKIKILSISGLPLGLDWELSKSDFDLATESDGCVRICGAPLEADTFEVLVNLEATVFLLKKQTSFRRILVVHPAVSTTDGFSMTGFEGCGSATVSFQNLAPSGGANGFFYAWNFGNGTTTSDENPPAQTYSSTGVFPVSYHALIDTAGHNLLKINVLGLTCKDVGFNPGALPDLFLLVKNEADETVFNSSPDVLNASVPRNFSLDLALEKGKNYTLEVWDEDSSLGGTDDLCGAINFTTDAAGDTLKNGDLRAVLEIFHPTTEIFSTDTVRVFAKPAQPIVSVFPNVRACEGDSIRLASGAQLVDYQWFMDGEKIAGATDSVFWANAEAEYFLVVTTADGCSATSEKVELDFLPRPLVPHFYADQNVLYLTQPANLPATYALFWFYEDSLITNDSDFDLCAFQSGLFALEVEDLATGCRARAELSVEIDPTIDCVSGASEEAILEPRPFRIFPNPTRGELTFEAKTGWQGPAEIQVWTPNGVRLGHFQVPENSSSETFELETRGFSSGFFFLKIQRPDGRFWLEKLVLVR